MPRPRSRAINRLLRARHKTSKSAIRAILREPEARLLYKKFLRKIENRIESRPTDGKILAPLSVRLAFALDEPCLKTWALGTLMSTHILLGRYGAARRTAALISSFLGDCNECRADLHRRQAHLLLVESRFDEALAETDRAFELYAHVDSDSGRGKVHFLRGMVYLHAENNSLARQNLDLALAMLSPTEWPQYHAAALHSLTLILSRGSDDDARQALANLAEVKELYKGKRGLTAERAKLRWVEGLLCARIGWEARATDHLERARNNLIKLEMPQEVAAITADLALLAHPVRNDVRAVVRDIARLDLDFGHLKKSLAALWESTRTKNPWIEDDPDGSIFQAIEGLRQAVSEDRAPRLFVDYSLPEPDLDPVPIGF